jgi:hypothetical protein
MLTILCQAPRKRPGAAAYFKSVPATLRDIPEQEIVIVVVCSPTFVVEKRQAIKICSD